MMCNHSNPITFFLVCLAFLLRFRSSASAFTSHSQCLHLLELKKGFLFSNATTTSLSSWLPATDCCAWEGITCEQVSGLVVSLDLSDRGISGKIMPSLFNITSIQSLNLGYNSFDESPLLEIGNLANLTHLNLSNSGVFGQVPLGISHLKKLVSLDLSWSPPLQLRKLVGGLSNLKELYLNGVNVSANGTEWCGVISESTPKLEVLSLVGCSLSGPIDSSLSKLRYLSRLRLDNNDLSTEVPVFFEDFSSLVALSLFNCNLQGLFPKRVFQLKNLKYIDISRNDMLSGSLPEFPKDSTLESLLVSSTNFSGFLPDSLGNLKTLMGLDLSACHFSGSIPLSFRNLSKLVYLNLSHNNFSGKIPLILGGDWISEILLSNNNLTGSIPQSFGQLNRLVTLDLQKNSLSGPIPMSLFTLPALQVLQLNENKFFGQLEEFLNASSVLEVVDLGMNNLQAEVPRSMFDLSGLMSLTLSSNNFSGTIELDLFRNLQNLEYLDLSNNKLTVLDGADDSSLLPSLAVLRMESCNLMTIPAFLKHKNNTECVDLSNNRIGGTIPDWIWSIGDISMSYCYLNLSHNFFTGIEGPPSHIKMSIGFILDLRSNLLEGPIPLPPPNSFIVDYSNNHFTSSIPSNMSYYLTSAVFLSLSDNNLTGEIPVSICNATNLRVLDVSFNSLNGSLPGCLMESLSELLVLRARGNRFQGAIPQQISSRCALQKINLHGNKLEGRVPRSLANCNKLEFLDFGSNKLVDSFPYWLGNLPALKVLVLRENGFYGPFGNTDGNCEGNYTFSMVHILDISSNNFTGTLPSDCFKNMKAMMSDQEMLDTSGGLVTNFSFFVGLSGDIINLFDSSDYWDLVTVALKGVKRNLVNTITIFVAIDMSNNQFEGHLPEAIGDLTALISLNMSGNAFNDQIPQVFENLMELQSLDLSQNHLSGQIPNSLASLTFLSFLNLSNNNLVGRIPYGNQFSTFSRYSFEGNPGLCGNQLSRQCVSSSVEPSSDFSDTSTEFDMEVVWTWLFTGLGFGLGLAFVIGFQMLFPRWKIW
ncbi:receptor like protein 22-like [Dioscorea cayenensis subsp. rotundata]|uniref:Receptor like protein 22-like n=1 Tax=Dioscorea cayennensis subsp. rotundata TaxID=55577 RepID=A0AB40C0I7_DIOCR|nr:receptor like protein 22-like [Dioscorea cayenensis subsp. rotundata]